MKVVAGGLSCGTDEGDGLSCGYGFSFFNKEFGTVGIAGFDAVAVVDDYIITIIVIPRGIFNGAAFY